MLINEYSKYYFQLQCVIKLPDFWEDVLRPPFNCSYCKGMDTIEKILNMSADNFLEQ